MGEGVKVIHFYTKCVSFFVQVILVIGIVSGVKVFLKIKKSKIKDIKKSEGP